MNRVLALPELHEPERVPATVIEGSESEEEEEEGEEEERRDEEDNNTQRRLTHRFTSKSRPEEQILGNLKGLGLKDIPIPQESPANDKRYQFESKMLSPTHREEMVSPASSNGQPMKGVRWSNSNPTSPIPLPNDASRKKTIPQRPKSEDLALYMDDETETESSDESWLPSSRSPGISVVGSPQMERLDMSGFQPSTNFRRFGSSSRLSTMTASSSQMKRSDSSSSTESMAKRSPRFKQLLADENSGSVSNTSKSPNPFSTSSSGMVPPQEQMKASHSRNFSSDFRDAMLSPSSLQMFPISPGSELSPKYVRQGARPMGRSMRRNTDSKLPDLQRIPSPPSHHVAPSIVKISSRDSSEMFQRPRLVRSQSNTSVPEVEPEHLNQPNVFRLSRRFSMSETPEDESPHFLDGPSPRRPAASEDLEETHKESVAATKRRYMRLRGSSSEVETAFHAPLMPVSPAPLSPVSMGGRRRSRRVQVDISAIKHGIIIGRGSFGSVFMGMDMNSGQQVAIKKMPFAVGQERQRAYEEEMKVMQGIQHENIVQYLGARLDDNNVEIYMEFVAGGSIASLIKMYGPLSDKLVSRFTLHMLSAVQYLHSNNVIHRDIKGANILITINGVAKLADFGCSRLLLDMSTHDRDETLSRIRGSVPWMAPEVVREVKYHFPADIWSVGATVLEMASGTRPWPDLTDQVGAIFQIGNTKTPPPIPAFVSITVRDFLHECFYIDPAKRLTAADLLAHTLVA